jgi:hypothetical protein
LLVAVFSCYLVVTGWLRARNRSAVPTVADWVATTSMAVASAAMAVWSLALLRGGSSLGIVLLVFAGVGGTLSLVDVYFLRGRRYRGLDRIIAHLARMLDGAIAALTAFTVVNVHAEPAFIPWLAPTVLLTPLIFYWAARVQRSGLPETRSPRTPRAA